MSGYGLHPGAYEDLDLIWQHVESNSQSRDVAQKVEDAIFDAIAALVPLPGKGHHRADLTDRPLRFISVYSYLVAYDPNKQPLRVLAVLPAKDDPRRLASQLEARQ
jgi:antitoxin ParD1/3/4/toxin ParE1/3/4